MLIICFIDGFTSVMKSQSIANLFIGSAHIYIYIGFRRWNWRALNMRFSHKLPSRMQGQCFFSNWTGHALVFSQVQKISKKLWGLPQPTSPSPYKFIGVTLASAPKWSVMNWWKADDKKLQGSKIHPDSGICFWLRCCGLIGGPAIWKQAIFPWREDRLQNLYNVLSHLQM
jgi:hypothetical protein